MTGSLTQWKLKPTHIIKLLKTVCGMCTTGLGGAIVNEAEDFDGAEIGDIVEYSMSVDHSSPRTMQLAPLLIRSDKDYPSTQRTYEHVCDMVRAKFGMGSAQHAVSMLITKSCTVRNQLYATMMSHTNRGDIIVDV